MFFSKKSPTGNVRISNFCTKIPCSKSWGRRKLERMRLSTIPSKWGTSLKRSKNSTCLKIWKRGGRNTWAASEESPPRAPAHHQVQEKEEESIKKTSTSTNIEEREAPLRKDHVRGSNQKNHTNSQNCSKIISKIVSEASPSKMRKATWDQITPCTRKNTRPRSNSTRKIDATVLKKWRKMLKNYKPSEKVPANAHNLSRNPEITKVALPKSEVICWTSSRRIATTSGTRVQIHNDDLFNDWRFIYVVSDHIFLRINLEFFEVPDVFGVLFDGAVAAEVAGPEGIQDGHSSPFFLVEVSLINFLLAFDVGLEISCEKVDIVVVGDGAYQIH